MWEGRGKVWESDLTSRGHNKKFSAKIVDFTENKMEIVSEERSGR